MVLLFITIGLWIIAAMEGKNRADRCVNVTHLSARGAILHILFLIILRYILLNNMKWRRPYLKDCLMEFL